MIENLVEASTKRILEELKSKCTKGSPVEYHCPPGTTLELITLINVLLTRERNKTL